MTLRITVLAAVVDFFLLLTGWFIPILLWVQYFFSVLTLGLIVLWVRDLEVELEKKKERDTSA